MIPMKQPDYLGDVGRVPRLLALVVVGAFAALFSFMAVTSAVGVVVTAVRGEWDITPILAGGTVGFGLVGGLMIWMFRRIRQPDPVNGVTRFPTWFIQLIGALLMPGAVLGVYHGVQAGNAQPGAIGIALGAPTAMLIVPWLVRRRNRQKARPPAKPSAPPDTV